MKDLLNVLMNEYEFAFDFGLHVLDRAIEELKENTKAFIRLGYEEAARDYAIVLVRALRIRQNKIGREGVIMEKGNENKKI